MHKKLIPIEKVKTNYILANEVVSNKGILLAVEGTAVNGYMLNKLIEFGVNQLWVYNYDDENGDHKTYEQIKETYKASVKTIKNIILRLSAGENLDETGLEFISDFVYTQRNKANLIIRCLEDTKKSDEYTYRHCINVALYSMLAAKWLGFDENNLKGIIQAGLLHDIGKIKIPSEILNKKGRLTSEEYEIMKNHSLYGYDILRRCGMIKDKVKKAVLFHHERIDGSGYPFGIINERIDLFSKIIAVADVYDAMTTDRIYKSRVPPFDAFLELGTACLDKFDSFILRMFLKNISVYYVGAYVRLSNGKVAEIEYVPPHDIVHPVVRVDSCFLDLSAENEIKIAAMI